MPDIAPSPKSFFTFNALESQRASGYRNTAYALAELIDNAFDANASCAKLLFFERRDEQGKKFIDEIIVSDDGDGMPTSMLEECLIFGKSGHKSIDEIVRDKKKGKFGYGLPNASLSQSPCIYVYSWQKPSEVFSSYLDLPELRKSNSIFVPTALQVSFPAHYRETASVLKANHGTIVSWTRCDRLSHTRAKKIIEKSSEVLGRLYRHLLREGRSITMEVWEHNPAQNTFTQTQVVPLLVNDPLYLATATYIESKLKQCAAEIHQPYAPYYARFVSPAGTCKPTNLKLEDFCYTFFFDWRSRRHKFEITTSYAHIDIQKPGIPKGANTPVGRKYGEKDHINFVRADREISSGDYGFYLKTEPQNRWWTIEVKFDADADDLLGVHNNKQGIEFVRTEDTDFDEEFNPHVATLQQARQQCWVELTRRIKLAKDAVWKQVRNQGKEWDVRFLGGNGGDAHKPSPVPENTATTTSATLKTDGARVTQFSKVERDALEVRLTEKYPKLSKDEIAEAIQRFDHRKVRGCVLYCPSDSDSLWSLTTVYEFLVVLVNTNHEFYQRIMAPLRNGGFETALSAIELFLSSLAWEEKERFSSSDERRDIIEEFRSYVGLHLNRYLRENDIEIHENDFQVGGDNGKGIEEADAVI